MAQPSHPTHSPPPRSFVRRSGRITPAQRRALETLWAVYAVEPSLPGSLAAVLDTPGPHILEIGFGNGEALLDAAAAQPASQFLGLEVHEPGIGRVLNTLHRLELRNVRLIRGDAVEVMELFPEGCLDSVWLFFPDPWPKKKHHKRRLVRPSFINSLARRLKPGGRVLVATDWEPYAGRMLEALDAAATLRNLAGPSRYAERPSVRPLTKFERRGITLGHRIWDLAYERI